MKVPMSGWGAPAPHTPSFPVGLWPPTKYSLMLLGEPFFEQDEEKILDGKEESPLMKRGQILRINY